MVRAIGGFQPGDLVDHRLDRLRDRVALAVDRLRAPVAVDTDSRASSPCSSRSSHGAPATPGGIVSTSTRSHAGRGSASSCKMISRRGVRTIAPRGAPQHETRHLAERTRRPPAERIEQLEQRDLAFPSHDRASTAIEVQLRVIARIRSGDDNRDAPLARRVDHDEGRRLPQVGHAQTYPRNRSRWLCRFRPEAQVMSWRVS